MGGSISRIVIRVRSCFGPRLLDRVRGAVGDALMLSSVPGEPSSDAVGIAIGAEPTSRPSGRLVLVRSDPRDLPLIVALSRPTYRKMIQNFQWAAGDNVFDRPRQSRIIPTW